MAAENDALKTDFVFTLAELTDDQRMRMQLEARKRYERDWNTTMSYSRREGIEEGIKQEHERNLKEMARKDAELAQLRAENEKLKAQLAQ